MAKCIVMLLGRVAIALRQEHGIVGSVVGIFKQRMLYPTSNLDISIVNQLAKMAAKTGVRICVCWGRGEIFYCSPVTARLQRYDVQVSFPASQTGVYNTVKLGMEAGYGTMYIADVPCTLRFCT